MKRSFTMLELVFVIVIIGILSVVVIPNTKTNSLQEAANQLVSHIRYTQHLAMVDDKYNSMDSIWFEKRWRLKFSKSDIYTDGKWSYSIFDDSSGRATGNPDPEEVAVNPLNSNKKLTGGATGATMIHTGDKEATNEMNIGARYGVLDVDFSQDCRTANTNKVITFDYLGKPIRGSISDMSSSYNSKTNKKNILILSQCIIDLCSVLDCKLANVNEKVSISIDSETGYIHIL